MTLESGKERIAPYCRACFRSTPPRAAVQAPTIEIKGDEIKGRMKGELGKLPRCGHGRKCLALPIDLIAALNDQGFGAKAIANRLKDRDIFVSYKTIQRQLTGQRSKQQLVLAI